MIFDSQRSLAEALGWLNRVANKKSPVESLSHVLALVEDDKITLITTDLSRTLAITLKGKREQGDVTDRTSVPCAEFAERVRVLPVGPVSVNIRENSVALKGDTARRFVLRTLPGIDFPQVPNMQVAADATYVGTIPDGSLAKVIGQVLPATSEDKTRPHLGAAQFELTANGSHVVTTDGHRIHKATIEFSAAGNRGDLRWLIMAASLRDLVHLFPDGDVEVHEQGETIWFIQKERIYGCKLLVAQFPSWHQAIPNRAPRTVSANVRQLLEATKAMSVAAREDIVTYSATKGVLELTTDGLDNASDAVELEAEVPKPWAFAANGRFVADALGACDEESVDLDVAGMLDVVFIKTSQFTALVMPCRSATLEAIAS